MEKIVFTLFGDTVNLIRYSKVNQPTKIASVTRKNAISSPGPSPPTGISYEWQLYLLQLFIFFGNAWMIGPTWNSGTVESINMKMEASKKKELTTTNTYEQKVKKKKGNYQQKIHLCCCGWVWVLKSFPNFISQSCTAHSLKLVILDHGPIRLKIAMMNWAGLALILKLPLPTNQLTRSSWSSPWSTIGSSQEALWSVYAQQGSVKLIVMNVVIIVTNLLYQDRGSWGPSTPAPPGSPWGTRSLSGAAHPSCRAPRYSRKPGVGDQSRTPLFQVKRSHIEREFQLKEKKLKLIDSQDNNWFWSLLPWSA